MSGTPISVPPGDLPPARILERQPVGTLIVDASTAVRFANQAAATMLGVPLTRLIGEAFGLPLVSEGVTDVNVPGADGTVRTLAMRVTPLEGARQLVTLFDVTGRARLYEHEHRLVESLQRSLLLDRMPQLPGVALAARYVAGDDVARVGGDWYDVIPLRDGRVGLAIGDVAGHGVDSAALMSQLRNALRAYALEHSSPATVVQRLDELIQHLEPRGMATMIYLIFDREAAELTFTAAGHPYPLLTAPDGGVSFLDGGRALPLGTGLPERRAEDTVAVTAGATLVLYTDGLIERRARPLDEGFERLASSLRAAPADPEEACERILAELLGDGSPMDDVALLVMMCADRP